MTLSPADVKVIHAFLDKQPASSKHLSTSGHQLDGLWMGGSGIATWSQYGRINVHDKGSKAAQQVQRKLVSIAPRNWFSPESSWALPASAKAAAERRKNPAVYKIEDYAAHNLGKLWVTKDGRRIAVISKGGTMNGTQLIDYIPLNGYKLIGNDGSVKLPKHLFPEIKRLLGVVSNPGKARVAFKPGKKGGNASRGGERDSRHPDHPWYALAMIEAKPAVRAFSDARLAEELALSQAAPIETYAADAWSRVLHSEAKRRGVKGVKQNPSFSVMHADGSLTPFANPRKKAKKNPASIRTSRRALNLLAQWASGGNAVQHVASHWLANMPVTPAMILKAATILELYDDPEATSLAKRLRAEAKKVNPREKPAKKNPEQKHAMLGLSKDEVRNTIARLKALQAARAAGYKGVYTDDPSWLIQQAINRRGGYVDDPHFRGSAAPVNGKFPKKAGGNWQSSARRLADKINTPRMRVYESELGEWGPALKKRLPHRFVKRGEEEW